MLTDESNDPALEFSDERFLTAAEKRLLLKAWNVFLKHGCQFCHFTERLYNHLIQHCSFIAHYDRGGFYSVYFEHDSPAAQRFLDQFDPSKPGQSAEYGDAFWLRGPIGSDLNKAMRESAAPYVNRLRFQFSEAERESDLEIATRLAGKWGKQLADCHGETQVEPEVRNVAPEGSEQLAMSFGEES